MSTLCTEVQEVISAAYDGQVSDRDAINAAKAHCATCAECASFVTFLGSVRNTAAPTAPESAIARVLDTVRTEAAQAAAIAEDTGSLARAGSTVPGAADVAVGDDASATTSKPVPEDTSVRAVTTISFQRPQWRAAAPWLAAAAVLVVGGVLVTAQGVRYIMSGPGTETALEAVTPDMFATQDDLARESVPDTPGESYSLDTGDAPDAPPYAPTEATSLVAYGGSAYRLAGEADTPTGPPVGSVSTALDTGLAPQRRDAWAGTSPGTIIVDAGQERPLLFRRVERTVGGRTFSLAAERIDSFASPVGLPPSIPVPTAPDGSPTFVSGGTDDAGVELFVRPGTTPEAGFALAPGTVSSEWTWWQPTP